MRKQLHLAVVLAGATAHLAACATGYHSKGFTGGFPKRSSTRTSGLLIFEATAIPPMSVLRTSRCSGVQSWLFWAAFNTSSSLTGRI